MLCCRRISAIGTPASPCFRMPTIWLSVNRDFRMGISLAPESLPSNGLPGGEAYESISVVAGPRNHERRGVSGRRSREPLWFTQTAPELAPGEGDFDDRGA